jgi:hypothetical protein
MSVEALASDPDLRPAAPLEVFEPWAAAQLAYLQLARRPVPDARELRRRGRLPADAVGWITQWYAGSGFADERRTRRAYDALATDTDRLYEAVTGGLSVTVALVDGDEPYACAAELCADLRDNRYTALRTAATGEPHPCLDCSPGGTLDRLRVVHDVFGHAALGLGFDLQSEFAAWLQCRRLFRPQALPAAFTELVGAVTAYVASGARPPLRADLPPAELLAVGG